MNSNEQSVKKWPAAFISLQVSQFRWLFGGNIAFFFVVQGQMVTRVFLAWDLTKQETALAMVSLAVAVPMFLAAMVSGAVADRVDRRFLLIAGQTILLASELFVLVLLLTDSLAFWHLLLVSFVTGLTFPFILPARMAIVFDIVGPGYFGNAMALANGVINLARVAGPAIMGTVLDIFGATGAYMVGVVLHVLAVLCLYGLHPNPPKHVSGKPLYADMVEGFRYIFNNKAVMVCIAFGVLPMLLLLPVQSLFVVFSDEIWHVGERGFGIMVAAGGVGGAIGAMWVAGRGGRARINVMVGSAMAFALLLCVFSLSPVFSVAIFVLMLANIFASATQTLNNTVCLMLADDNMRGRVSGLMGITYGIAPLGVLPLAFAAEKFGVDKSVAGGCVLIFVLVLAFYLLSPALRTMDGAVRARLNRS